MPHSMGDENEPCYYCPLLYPGVPPRHAAHCLSTSRKKTSLWPACTSCKVRIYRGYRGDPASVAALSSRIARPLTWSDVAVAAAAPGAAATWMDAGRVAVVAAQVATEATQQVQLQAVVQALSDNVPPAEEHVSEAEMLTISEESSR